ncbi:hypothetical protein QQX98_005508 [Neonectria punicea]|uniref:Major facilitator superfamily (MFS) profile domain-containing protein n=1 Tax=Neonectria punicea TaxID=979145 RepID=A0ABR1H4A1_9HYPO
MSDKKELDMMPEIESSTTTAVGDMKNVNEKGRPIIIEDAEEFLRTYQYEWGDYTEQDAKRVLRRIDWTDAVVNGHADLCRRRLYGMTEDLNLRGQQYSWAVSIFYFGYMLSAYPANATLQKFMFLRFVMGTTESFVFPCMTILVSMWYTKEQPLRSALTFTSFSTLFSGTISYGIGNADIEIAPWRLFFITLGAMTMLWGVVLFFTIPDSPLQENFMKGKDKYIAHDRVKSNMTGIENREFKLYQVKEAFTDYKLTFSFSSTCA